jgi:hypothetical protein
MTRRMVPLTGCDCFHLALDGMMQREGQGPNVALAVLELAGRLPDGALRLAVDRLAVAFPIVDARLHRRLPLGRPAWRLPRHARPPAVERWREPGVGGTDQPGTERAVSDVETIVHDRLGAGPPERSNLSFDEVFRADGTSALVITWRHVLLDAKGAELLVSAVDALGRESCMGSFVQTAAESLAIDAESLRARLAGVRAVGLRLDALREPAFRSLGGPKAQRSAARCRVMTLSGAAARTCLERAEKHSGAFAQMAFFLATAVRAHGAVFRARRVDPGAYVVSIPVQTRRKGSNGPIFQNHLSILLFGLPHDTDDLGRLTRSIRVQLAEMMRQRLDQRWADGLRLARRTPSAILMRMMRRRFRGEIASFFHSFTDTFADNIATLLGTRVVNAYHVPSVAAPPGTGLFVGRHDQHVNVTLSWREHALDASEAEMMLDSVRSDLLGSRARTADTPGFAVGDHR